MTEKEKLLKVAVEMALKRILNDDNEGAKIMLETVLVLIGEME